MFFCLLVSLFVCQCVHLLFPYSCFKSPQVFLKLIFGSEKVALGNNPAILCSVYESIHSETQKASFLAFELCLNQALLFDDHVVITLLVFLVCYYQPSSCPGCVELPCLYKTCSSGCVVTVMVFCTLPPGQSVHMLV